MAIRAALFNQQSLTGTESQEQEPDSAPLPLQLRSPPSWSCSLRPRSVAMGASAP